MKVLKGMTGATPLVKHFPEISPLKFDVESPIKVSYAESVGSKSPSPSKSDSDISTTSSSQVEPTHSPPRESAADGKHDETAPSSPKSDGSPKGKFPTSPKRSPPAVAPATVDKREMSTPLPSTPSPTKAAATKPVSAKASKKEKKKGKASSSTPKSSPSSSDDSSHSDSTPDRKARRKARRKEIKAEKVTRALAANFQLIKLVTEKFPKLGNANYDSWQRAWTHQAKSLGYNTSYMSVDGPEWNVKTEDASESVHRKNFAEMVIKTIDANEHERVVT